MNAGKQMAAGAAGGAIVSVTGGAPSMNPAAPPLDFSAMQDQATKIKGISTHVRRDIGVPEHVQMTSPLLMKAVFDNCDAVYQAAKYAPAIPEDQRASKAGHPIPLENPARQIASQLQADGYRANVRISHTSVYSAQIIEAAGGRVQNVALANRWADGGYIPEAIVQMNGLDTVRVSYEKQGNEYRPVKALPLNKM